MFQDITTAKREEQCVCVCVGFLSVAGALCLSLSQDITTAKGEEQCDEDDYGYESNMSQQIFSKLANQYANMPEDDKLKFVHNNKKGTIDDIKVSSMLLP